MSYALDNYKLPSCDITTCPNSSPIYRVNECIEIVNIFDDDDKISALPVIINILDGIHHYVFHLAQSGLRDFGDKDGDNKNDKDGEGDDYYDGDFAAMNKRILCREENTKRFARLGNNNKFSIDINNDNNNDIQDDDNVNGNDDSFAGITYLDKIYINLAKKNVFQAM